MVTRWPKAEVQLDTDGGGIVNLSGITTEIREADTEAARSQVTALIVEKAANLGRSIPCSIADPTGHWELLIHPNGNVSLEDNPRPKTAIKESPSAGKKEVAPSTETKKEDVKAEIIPLASSFAPEEEIHETMPRRSFLSNQITEQPAEQGWRGALARLGMPIAPSEAERAERSDVLAVSQHWAGPRTIAVVNGKGGAGKTPTVILLSAVFARYGGTGILAWDNNQTRGTLGWRTEQGPHDATLLELLPEVNHLLETGAKVADLNRYVHHQSADRYDVLRSQPLKLAGVQRIKADDVDAIHQVASKYYRIIIIDSGNDESDPVWQRMIDHTDQLVLATTTRDDHAEAGALLLEALQRRSPASAHLAHNAVVVVNQADPTAKATEVTRISEGFHGIAREAVTIPYDPAMVGGVLSFDALQPRTRRAWLAAAAAVTRGL
jgi:hypothetical protein